ncbi:EF-hand domain-containing protein [Chloropicon primus]|uniref:EF-hand domain-containing protein n=1 Tax=Chloropicon primus TaxID=1764295 RepID=A0A5B8MLM2_9CHLO|nr:hypothetical protein A3770_04p30630 [Chloropicon primus]UPQ99757.1 EF-hand domain-containing protein [Chloropicon primus]|eukprot:QDZ20545.1 hypothetical protein A3770_04p30630 [Chloropicon primus]
MDLGDKLLAFIGGGCLAAAVVCLLTSKLVSIGFFVAFLAIMWCFKRINTLELYRTLAESVTNLQEENEDLKGHVGNLEKQNNELEQNVDELGELKEDLGRGSVGKEGSSMSTKSEKGEQMCKNLTDLMYGKYKSENQRHKELLEQQSDFHFFQILQHFDQDYNGAIAGEEIDALIKYLGNKYGEAFDEAVIRGMGSTIPMKGLKEVLMKIPKAVV